MSLLQDPLILRLGTGFFLAAILHSLMTGYLQRKLEKFQARHPHLVHYATEIEAAFTMWALLFFVVLIVMGQGIGLIEFVRSIHFYEPILVFVVFVLAGSDPVIAIVNQLVLALSRGLASLVRVPLKMAELFVLLAICPLVGSLVTEPAAMAVAAPLVSRMIQVRDEKLLYVLMATLFVNISIGGALTHFAAPPILMVARPWGWSTPDVFRLFGIHSIVATVMVTILTILIFRKKIDSSLAPLKRDPIKWSEIKFFPLRWQSGLMIALFLATLLVFGPFQTWWLEPVLKTLQGETLYLVSTLLTAIVDNAALTYLGAQVPSLSDSSKYFLVAGAISGGGLTVIANAPNIVGLNLMRSHFPHGFDSKKLFISALLPTVVIAIIFGLF